MKPVAAKVAVAILLSWPLFAGSTPSTVALTSSENPSILGQAVTLTATVLPAGATGKVTFFDGLTIMETVVISSGQATLSSPLLRAGAGTLNELLAVTEPLIASITPSAHTQGTTAVFTVTGHLRPD